MPASTVALCNLKGGVGKTSTTFHLAGTLAKEGRRVLLLDVDPQARLTQGFFGPDAMRALPREATIAALFGDGLVPDPAELIRPTGFAGGLDRPRLRPPDPAQRPRALALRPRPAARPPRLHGRGPGPLRRHPVRLPPEPPPLRVGRPDGRRSSGRPAPGRGLRQPGDRRHPGVRRRGPGGAEPGPPPGRLPAHDVQPPARHPPGLRGDAPPALRRRRSWRRRSRSAPTSRRPSRSASRSSSTSPEGPRPSRSRPWPTSCSPGCLAPCKGTPRTTRGGSRDGQGQGPPANASGRTWPSRWAAGRTARATTASHAGLGDGQARRRVPAPEPAVEIEVGRIVADPDQPRTEFDPEAIARLAESLEDARPDPAHLRPVERGHGALPDRDRRAALAGLDPGRPADDRRRHPRRRADRVAGPGDAARRELPPRGPPADRAGPGVPDPDGPQRLDGRPAGRGAPVDRGLGDPGAGPARPPLHRARRGRGGRARPLGRLRGLASSTTRKPRPRSPPASWPRA